MAYRCHLPMSLLNTFGVTQGMHAGSTSGVGMSPYLVRMALASDCIRKAYTAKKVTKNLGLQGAGPIYLPSVIWIF